MNSFKNFLNNVIYPASLIYTIITAIFYIASSRMTSDSGTKTYAFLMLAILVYAVILALMFGIFRTKLPYIVRTLIHYLMVAGSMLILFAMAGSSFSPSSVVVILGILTLIYALIAIPVLIILYRKKSKENESKEYKSTFSGKR